MVLCFYDGIQFIEIKTMAIASPRKQGTENHQPPELGMHDIMNQELTLNRGYFQKLKKGENIPQSMVNTYVR